MRRSAILTSIIGYSRLYRPSRLRHLRTTTRSRRRPRSPRTGTTRIPYGAKQAPATPIDYNLAAQVLLKDDLKRIDTTIRGSAGRLGRRPEGWLRGASWVRLDLRDG